MKPSAVLLIDLENFYYSREDNVPGYDRHRFAADLEKLLGFAREMVEPLPFTVRRAYANFGVVRYAKGAAREFPLQAIPDALLRQGVEPVQVFRLSSGTGNGGRGGKNAADMRMAMDATALLAGGGHVEHFVLVTGDADFIPVILELKRQGYSVSVIGVANATNELIQRFVDNFELFEDLVAAEEVEARSGEVALAGDGMAVVAAAVRRLLGRTRPLRFAAVKPLLSKELGRTFDPGAFGCDTTGDFLRKYQHQLGVEIRVQIHDLELDLPNGTSKTAPRAPARPTEPEPHSRAHYQQLLAGGGPADSPVGATKVAAVPWPVLIWSCEAVVAALTPPDGGPATSQQLLPRIFQAAEGAGLADLDRHLRRLYPTLRTALPVTDGLLTLPAEAVTGEQLRGAVLRHVARVLTCRLAEAGVPGPIRPAALAAVFDPGPAADQVTTELTGLLAESPAPIGEVASPGVPAAEEVHTPGGYMRLLKAGGPKGSETETLKVLPVPWTSVEQVCLDAFAAMAPAAGGAPMPRERLQALLTGAGRPLGIERYDQHVRRTLGILRVAGELLEADGLLSLNPDLPSAQDLRSRALAFLLDLLRYRLEERSIDDPIRPAAFVTALEAGPLAGRLLDEVTPAIEWLYREQRPEPAPSEPARESAPDLPPPEPPAPRRSDEEVPPPPSHVSGGDREPYSLDDPPALATEDAYDSFANALAEVDAEPGPPGAPPGETSDVIDMAVITREAVESVNEPPPVIPVGRPGEPLPPVFPPPRPAAPAEPASPKPAREAFPIAIPVADWVPDADPLLPEFAVPDQLVHEPPAPAPAVDKMIAPPTPPPESV
jgi:uncharacterized LabA/DUF88 family protein